MRHCLVGFAVLSLGIGGCQLIGGFEDFEAATGSGSDAGGSTPGASCGAGTSPGKAAPEMSLVPWAGGACFWMDQTEVTRGQYQTFLDAKVNPTGQASLCAWNTAFDVDSKCAGAASTASPELPATCIDWCDALAYCTWAGKKLCQGSAAGAAKASESRWYAACSKNGTQDYPYGNTFDVTRCNGEGRGCASGDCQMLPAGSNTTCTTVDGIKDLLGNASEWTDECDATNGENDGCKVHGGGVNDPADSTRCSVSSTRQRKATGAFLGFRCCAEQP